MTKALTVIIAGALLGGYALAQAPDEQTGAKAIFLNSITNEQTLSPADNKTAPDKKEPVKHKQITKTALPAVTGVMYYLELLRPSGELTRVNSDHVFHSGDRIRLHLSSNIDGNLIIFQSEDGSEPQVLFPSPKLADGSARVTKGSDVVLPSPKAWFKFDDHPGQILLRLKLSADSKPSPVDDNPTLMADAGSAHDIQEAQMGSKALVIETDDSPSDPSKVVVVDTRRDSKIAPGQIAIDIKLIHQS